VKFRSIVSGSHPAGNCFVMYTDTTRIWIDAGMQHVRRRRPNPLDERTQHIHSIHTRTSAMELWPPDALFCSHAHTDHRPKDAEEYFGKTYIQHTDEREYRVGDMTVVPFPVRHDPSAPTSGFKIYGEGGGVAVVIPEGEPEDTAPLRGCDFLYIETNHDLYWAERCDLPEGHRYQLKFHMDNAIASVRAFEIVGDKRDAKVMIGNISPDTNSPALARTVLQRAIGEYPMVAPRWSPSRVVNIGG